MGGMTNSEASGSVPDPPGGHGLFRRCALWLAPFFLVMVVWALVAWGVTRVRGVPFPMPWETFRRLIGLLFLGEPLLGHSIYADVGCSLRRWGLGFGLAMIGGMTVGLAAGWRQGIERVIMPCVHMIQLIPGLAWIPVALLLFGVGERATVFMIAVTAFAPIAINVQAGVKHVDEVFVRAARMMGARGGELFVRVLLPGALPHILSGLRVGLGNGWRVLVAGEMVVGAGTGLGHAIIQARWTLDYTSAFACVVIICLVGLVLERLVFLPLERRTVERWGLRRER